MSEETLAPSRKDAKCEAQTGFGFTTPHTPQEVEEPLLEWLAFSRPPLRLGAFARVYFRFAVKYVPDTDTALMEFTDNEVAETKEISENIYVDLDRQGNLVSMTVEPARTNAQLPEVAYQEVPRRT